MMNSNRSKGSTGDQSQVSCSSEQLDSIEKKLSTMLGMMIEFPIMKNELAETQQTVAALCNQLSNVEEKVQMLIEAFGLLVNHFRADLGENNVFNQILAKLFKPQDTQLSSNNLQNKNGKFNLDNTSSKNDKRSGIATTEWSRVVYSSSNQPVVKPNNRNHQWDTDSSDSSGFEETEHLNQQALDLIEKNRGSAAFQIYAVSSDSDSTESDSSGNDTSSNGLRLQDHSSNCQQPSNDLPVINEMDDKLIIKDVRVYERNLATKSMSIVDKGDLIVEHTQNGFTLSYTSKGNSHIVWLNGNEKMKPMQNRKNSITVSCYGDATHSVSQVLILVFDNEEDIDTLKWFVKDAV